MGAVRSAMPPASSGFPAVGLLPTWLFPLYLGQLPGRAASPVAGGLCGLVLFLGQGQSTHEAHPLPAASEQAFLFKVMLCSRVLTKISF